MKANHVAINLKLWRTVGLFLPASLQDLRIMRCTIKFRLTPRAGTKAEVHIAYVEGDGYDARERKRRAQVQDPYALFNALKDIIKNWPEAAVSLDLTIDPNGPAKIKTAYLPLLKEE